MKIGCIFCAHNAESMLADSLRPWIEARRDKLAGHEWLICAISYPFVGFDVEPPDNTLNLLGDHDAADEIDCVMTDDLPIAETVARGNALRWLIGQDCDISVLVDVDEFWTTEQITRAFAFVAAKPDIAWFKVAYKNYVFDDKTYLVQPFTPPRIHRVRVDGYRAHSFEQDNDVTYGGVITRDLKSQAQFPSALIPKGQVWVSHMSWLSNDRSRRKQAYQRKRWGLCDFAWDDAKGGLIWSGAPRETTTE